MAHTYIFDTDAGIDDIMALAWLMLRKDVTIEAITIAYGLAHRRQGAINLSRIVALSGQNIPVYIGQRKGTHAFPDRWRDMSNRLPGVDLPAAYKMPEEESANTFLHRRLQSKQKVNIIALGALSNMAGVCSGEAVERLGIMGGAFNVRGNASPTAEWNIFVDPLSARAVMEADVNTLIVPLDATNCVPITPEFIDRFQAVAHSPLGCMVGQALEIIRHDANKGREYAWDPLTAVAMLHPEIIRTRRHGVTVDHTGTTHITDTTPAKTIAVEADADQFMRLFLEVFR